MYGSARKSYLQTLDSVHHQGLRLALGAFRTSPITSLYVEADEPSLYLRREKISLQYAVKLAANPSNPAFKVTFSPQFSELYELKPHSIKPFGLRVSSLLEGGGRVVRWFWVNFQCRGVLLVWIRVGQGPTALAVGAGGGCLDIFYSHLSFLFSFSLSLGDDPI